MPKLMKWIGISGGWRKTNLEIEQRVRATVRETILAGNGIITGGALNVGYFATDEALKRIQMPLLKNRKTPFRTKDELVVFQVHHSLGTQDTIDKANQKGIQVIINSYTIE